MSRPINPPHTSSRESAQAIVLRPERSRRIPLAWIALHALVAGAVAATGLPWLAKVPLGSLVIAHGVTRRPKAHTGRLICRADGSFDLPDQGLEGLELGAASAFTDGWVRLVLVANAAKFDVLLSKDQLDEESWRLLLARLGGATI